MTEIGKCESCKREKDVVDVEGNLLCEECSEDVVRCSFCNILFAINYETLEDNFGVLCVPELSLPDIGQNLIFCGVGCLEKYVQKYKKECEQRKERETHEVHEEHEEIEGNQKKLKGDTKIVRYARIVFEEEIPDNATSEDALVLLLKSMKNAQTYLKGEDVEISDCPYERVE